MSSSDSLNAGVSVTFQIKWGKETVMLENYTPTSVSDLKMELSQRTGVPTDRMKIMAKSKGLWKGVLKDEVDLARSVDWKSVASASNNLVQLLLMGSATELVGPKVKTVFVEDLPPEQLAAVVEPAGLVNLGNTCYLNSVVQCLRAVPQLRSCLSHYSPANLSAMSTNMTSLNNNNVGHTLFMATLRDTYRNLDRQATPYEPIALVQATKMAFPQFAQTSPNGHPMQQDAEEFFSGLLTIAASEMQKEQSQRRHYIQVAFQTANSSSLTPASAKAVSDEELMGANNAIDALFGMKMRETLTCDELNSAFVADDVDASVSGIVEPPVITHDLHRKLVCNIQGGSDGSATGKGNTLVNVNHIAEGIMLSLGGKIEKHSEVLGRNAIWTRTQRIARLPPVLTIQFGRFYWKATPDSQDHPMGVKCKVMKPVVFQTTLDVYDYCVPEIQQVLSLARSKALSAEEERINKKLKGDITEQPSSNNVDNVDNDVKMEGNDTTNAVDGDEEIDDELKAALALSMQTTTEDVAQQQPPIGPGLPPDFQGIYELFAVVTHKGRDADGGHYMAWVKADNQSNDNRNNSAATISKTKKTTTSSGDDDLNEDWFVFDDDEVSPCKTEDVLKLKGGGDWHMSYLNFYRCKK